MSDVLQTQFQRPDPDDYSESKQGVGVVWPDKAINAAWREVEPLVTPEQVRSRHLFGIPLVSAIRDPVTKQRQRLSDEQLMDQIIGAVSDAQLETHLDLMPRKYREKHPFDKQLYDSLGYFQLEHRPAATVDRLTITTSDDQDVYIVPIEWVDVGRLSVGQINLIPLTVAIGSSSGMIPAPAQGAAGAAFLAVFGTRQWISSFWQIDYTTGFPDGMLPRPVNDLVGVIAAMRVLSMLAATYATVTGASIGLDGVSQSLSTPGPSLFKGRVDDLAVERDRKVRKLKTMYGLNLICSSL